MDYLDYYSFTDPGEMEGWVGLVTQRSASNVDHVSVIWLSADIECCSSMRRVTSTSCRSVLEIWFASWKSAMMDGMSELRNGPASSAHFRATTSNRLMLLHSVMQQWRCNLHVRITCTVWCVQSSWVSRVGASLAMQFTSLFRNLIQSGRLIICLQVKGLC